MSITNPLQSVAENVCGDQGVCGPASIEASLSCSPIGWSQSPTQGWLFEYGIITVQFWDGPCPPSNTYTLSAWIPGTITFRFCPKAVPQNQEPDPTQWVSDYAYFGGVSAGLCTNQYRARATLIPASPTTVNVSVTVQVLNLVDGVRAWVGYASWAQTMSEIPGRVNQYDSRGYQTSQQYVPISVSQSGGKGNIGAITMVAGVVPFVERCGEPCGLFHNGQFQGCANAVMHSKTDAFVPYPFVMGRNPNPCGTNMTAYCYCDQITLTSLSPVEGITVNNEYEGPNANDFVQVFGVTGLPGETVGAVQQLQVGVAPGGYFVMKNINGGQLHFGFYDTTALTWAWGASQQVREGDPTVYFVDLPDRYAYVYCYQFPNQDILPVCPGTSTTPYPESPTSTTSFVWPPTTTSTTSTTCLPPMMGLPPDVPEPAPPTKRPNPLSPEQVRQMLRQAKPCNCGPRR